MAVSDHFFWIILLFCWGAILGSFVMATVWRLRAQQLKLAKKTGEDYDEDEYTELVEDRHLDEAKPASDRSRCLSCGHQLAWYDLIPLVSWLSLKGKCRYCRASIGWFEPLSELILAALFGLSFVIWPLELNSWISYGQLFLWFVLLVVLAVLFIYDLKWMLLPSSFLYAGVVAAALFWLVGLFKDFNSALFVDLGLSILILAGLYWLLSLIANKQLVGSGDSWLGLIWALVVSNWRLALIVLFLANLLGSLVVLPSLIKGKSKLKHRIPFGPFFIAAGVVVWLGQNQLLSWFGSLFF